MNKKALIGASMGVALLLSSALPSFAAAPDNFAGEGSAFTYDGNSHYTNNYNSDLRFDWLTMRKAVPGEAFEHFDDNSAVFDNGYSLVDPAGTL